MDITNLFSLTGRTALITGGSRGIGRMIAQAFLVQGARVYISSRNADACDRAAAQLSEFGEVRSLPADVSTPDGTNALLRAYSEHEDALDILVNNAGAAWGAPYDEFPVGGWDRVMDLNLKTPFFLAQAMTPMLRKAVANGHPKVINIASIDGISVGPRETYSYAASKAGLIQLTRLMALRLAPEGIVVSAIAPGAFATDLNKSARDHGDEVAAFVPLGRIGRPEDIGGAAVYLASRAGDYVVGSTLVVDGGATHAR
ncbi:SDR family oxidoreductase [Variovorax paradoxus]|uniref:NAD(P)-dependent dehydrogenase (Short-subunit alcohol dehydrogenase family) n=1 Tax=Variovorax paradoxus TaxID=34073 RepID=A0AAW8ERF3_VARPD|nr:SDR family oxidoreductase [Variovorax paradoxus]MDP9975257.1 NAD(P)-dependent dehydrogenase (short-subunit alcohol dehydrogenase family) [Variovorax paradoxus]